MLTAFDFVEKVAGSMIGICRLKLPSGLIINDCPVFKKEQRSWIGLPNKYSADLAGNKTWKPYIEFETPEQTESFRKQTDLACKKLFETLDLSKVGSQKQFSFEQEVPF